jgi:hypothetical protein
VTDNKTKYKTKTPDSYTLPKHVSDKKRNPQPCKCKQQQAIGLLTARRFRCRQMINRQISAALVRPVIMQLLN